MTQFVGYIAMSLDGRIADGEGELEWLTSMPQPDAMRADYDAFYAGLDGLVMGRATYDWIVTHHDWMYPGKKTWVVTSRPLTLTRDDIVAVPADFPALKASIEAEDRRNVWIVGGGVTQRAALDAGMLDRLRVFVVPVIVGSGPSLFADGGFKALTLAGCREWGGGAVELSYSISD